MNTMTYYCLAYTLSVHLKRQRYCKNNLELPTTIMDKSLEFFEDTLRTSIADLSQLIRREALINSPTEHQKALSSIVYFTLLKDELSRLLSAENAVIVTVQRVLEGKPFESNDLILSEDSATTAQEYCYSFFTRIDCPLGSASAELGNWIASYVDQQQSIRDSFTHYFPDVQFLLGEVDSAGVINTHSISEAELFDSRTRGLLDDIERNRALIEFNERMLLVKSLLERNASAVQILSVLLNEPLIYE